MLDEAISNQFARQSIESFIIVDREGVVEIEADRIDLSKAHRPVGVDRPVMIKNRGPDRHRDHVEPAGSTAIV